MMNNNQELTNALLDANRKRAMGGFRENPVLDTLFRTSTPKKASTETVEVEFTPSGMTDVYVDSWFKQVARVFRGDLQSYRPELASTEEEEKQLFGRYLETLFWRKMVAVDGVYGKGDLSALKNEVTNYVAAPALFTNAVSCIGIVHVHNLAIRLTPVFAADYNWKERILSKEDWIKVTDWIFELMNWGFQAYEGFNATKDGNLDFMLMSVAEEEAVDSVEGEITGEEGSVVKPGEGRNCRFVIKSQRAASNIVALYRYFFHNKKVEYLTDTRLTYSYSDYESTKDAVDYIVNMMIWNQNVPSFLDVEANMQAAQDVKAPEQE